MDNLGRDLGCIKTLYVERQKLNSTIWKEGILFYYISDVRSASYGSASYVGVFPGATLSPDLDSLEQFGAPSTWQVIFTGNDTVLETILHHEVLHALGFQHEHARPDRDEYLQFENVTLDQNYEKMNAQNWPSQYPLELQSALMYANNENFNKKNGEPITGVSPRLTTTDALEVQELYCMKNQKFKLKEHVMCSSEDELGFTRPVFVDRICDGIKDCHDGSDEDESRFECKRTSICCDGYYLWDHTWTEGQKLPAKIPLTTYSLVTLTNNEPFYRGLNYLTGQDESLMRIDKGNGEKRWYIGVPENANISEYFLKDQFLDTKKECPPVGSQWSNAFKDRNVTLECFHQKRKVDFCSEASCDFNAHCINQLDSYKCECNYGFTGNGKSCSPIVKIDECYSRLHDCSENALCVDLRYGYTCECNDGFIDRDSSQPGRQCESLVPSNGCCQEFGVFSSIVTNVTEDELVLNCAIENYSKFKFSPLRQSYKCDIDAPFLAKYPDYHIPGMFKFAEFTNIYFEYDGEGWKLVDRDENMNLIEKYNSRLESLMDKISYHNDLCFSGDFSAQVDASMLHYLYGECRHRIGSKKE